MTDDVNNPEYSCQSEDPENQDCISGVIIRLKNKGDDAGNDNKEIKKIPTVFEIIQGVRGICIDVDNYFKREEKNYSQFKIMKEIKEAGMSFRIGFKTDCN